MPDNSRADAVDPVAGAIGGSDHSGEPVRVRRAVRRTWLVRPSTWAGTYLLLVPLYALLYTWAGGGKFAQSNQAFEREQFSEARNDIENRMAPGFASALRPEIEADIDVLGIGGALGFPVLRVSSPESPPLDIWFNNGEMMKDGSWCAVGSPVQAIGYIIRSPGQLPDMQSPAPPEVTGISEELLASVFHAANPSQPGCDGYWITSDGRIQVMASLEGDSGRAFLASYRLYASDPTFGKGAWKRMIYFSAVTITTLGFGDITPVSDSMRLLVASEAILGVVLAGLYLNAVWRFRSTDADASTPND